MRPGVDSINVKLIDFPAPGHEMVVENEDMSYTILINAKLAYADQLKAYQHAMKHIMEGDFQEKNVQSIEAQAHDMMEIPHQNNTIPARQFEDRIRRIQRERKRLQEALEKREREIELLQEIGVTNEGFFCAAERHYLYGWEG